MKKFVIFGCVGAILSACDATPSVEEYCLKSAKEQGNAITTEMKAHCKCVQKQMMINFGPEKTDTLVKFLMTAETEGTDAALKSIEDVEYPMKPVKDGFVQISVQCAAQSGIIE